MAGRPVCDIRRPADTLDLLGWWTDLSQSITPDDVSRLVDKLRRVNR